MAAAASDSSTSGNSSSDSYYSSDDESSDGAIVPRREIVRDRTNQPHATMQKRVTDLLSHRSSVSAVGDRGPRQTGGRRRPPHRSSGSAVGDRGPRQTGGRRRPRSEDPSPQTLPDQRPHEGPQKPKAIGASRKAPPIGRGEASPSKRRNVAGGGPHHLEPRRTPIGRGEVPPSKRQNVAGGGPHHLHPRRTHEKPRLEPRRMQTSAVGGHGRTPGRHGQRRVLRLVGLERDAGPHCVPPDLVALANHRALAPSLPRHFLRVHSWSQTCGHRGPLHSGAGGTSGSDQGIIEAKWGALG